MNFFSCLYLVPTFSRLFIDDYGNDGLNVHCAKTCFVRLILFLSYYLLFQGIVLDNTMVGPRGPVGPPVSSLFFIANSLFHLIPVLHSLLLNFHLSSFLFFFFRLCRTLTKRYLITSQMRVQRVSWIHHRTFLRMVRWCIRLTRLTLVCEVIGTAWLKSDKVQKKKTLGLAAQNRLSLSLLFSFSSSSYLLSFSKKNQCLNWSSPPPIFFAAEKAKT